MVVNRKNHMLYASADEKSKGPYTVDTLRKQNKIRELRGSNWRLGACQ